LVVSEKSAAMAVKTVATHASHARFTLGHEKFKAALFFVAEFSISPHGVVETGVVAGQ
jgi:hypothetical protein